jgi:hypothetical protein
MSAENHIDPGVVSSYLPELSQVEEIVIAWAYVQMLVKRVCRHQYQYTGYCVAFMQNIVQTVDMLPNLLSELDIVLLRPLEGSTDDDGRYRRQFRTDFRVYRQCVLTWLYFLKANYPDYRHITIATDRLAALLVDSDISLSVMCVTDDTLTLDGPAELTDAPLNTQLVVLSLDQDATEAVLIIEEITGCRLLPTGIPALSIRRTPIDEASRRERILSIAFLTLYPTGQADLNTPRLRNVPLKDYARYLLCWHDMRFAHHACWRFFVFNIYMRQKAQSTAQFYVSRTSHIKDLTCEELIEALNTDINLLPQIVRQGALLPGTCPYWRNRFSSLLAYARFLYPSVAPVFLTFSCADIQ